MLKDAVSEKKLHNDIFESNNSGACSSHRMIQLGNLKVDEPKIMITVRDRYAASHGQYTQVHIERAREYGGATVLLFNGGRNNARVV